ncbi:MAG TPA: argininosuccinate lyase [Candidatus Kapabacteria bacterium]|nr:argininosuccinate lyase [Candidatus Kapabacteria bacterium]
MAKKSPKQNFLWNSRFRAPLHDEALRFSSSIAIDTRLYAQDIAGSIAHAEMLAKQKIITQAESKKIVRGLLLIEKEIHSGKFDFDWRKEDIHTAIELRLKEIIGETAGKLHTGRSRNDQVAVDERLFLREAIIMLAQNISDAQRTLLSLAEKYADLVIPGYTHLQQAQPILAAHYFLAWMEMLDRDAERLENCYERVNRSPLGAAAFAGTPLPIAPEKTAETLGFDETFINSIDAVSDRDHIVEFISACAIIMMHLSRFAEDMVIYSSTEFSIIEIADEFTTGSSIMPHKKNPDIAELLRGKTGRVYGDLVSLLTTMKAAPLSYSRDLQEDKQPMFDAYNTAVESLKVLGLMMQGVTFNTKRCKEILANSFITATDIADYLVRKNVPFREAHHITGAIVAYAVERKIFLNDISIAEYKEFSPKIGDNIYTFLDPEMSIARKRSAGSTSPKEVKKQLLFWKKELGSK